MNATVPRSFLALVMVLTVGCATPPDERDRPSEEDVVDVEEVEAPEPDEEPEPPRRDTGGELSPAASSLLSTARGLLRGGDADGALNLVERAQRISPDAAEVYFMLGQVHRERGDLGRAEQFVLKGITQAGNNAELQKRGWSLLVGIREDDGDEAGARQAEERVSNIRN